MQDNLDKRRELIYQPRDFGDNSKSASSNIASISDNTGKMLVLVDLIKEPVVVPVQSDNTNLITSFMRKMAPEEVQEERSRLAMNTFNSKTAVFHISRMQKADVSDTIMNFQRTLGSNIAR